MANLGFISTARTRSPTSDGGGDAARPGPVRGGGVGEVQDVEAEAGAEGDEGGEAEPPDPSAFQGGDQTVVGGSVVAGGVQGGGETSATSSGLVGGGTPVAHISPLLVVPDWPAGRVQGEGGAGGRGGSVGLAGHEEEGEGEEEVGGGLGGAGERANQVPPDVDLIPDIEVAVGDGVGQQEGEEEEILEQDVDQAEDMEDMFDLQVPHQQVQHV